MVAIIGFVLLMLIVLGGYYYLKWNNEELETVLYQIESSKIPSDLQSLKIVLIADLHNHLFGEHNQVLIDRIKKQKPDFILAAGDLIIKRPDFKIDDVLELMEELVKICPVYYGNGNHEKKVSEYWEKSKENFELFQKKLADLGVRYLMDDICDIVVNGVPIRIGGLDLELKHYQKCWVKNSLTIEELKKCIHFEKNSNRLQILIAHNPKYFTLYERLGADLVVSGHVHGGIVVLPILGGVIAPDYSLFPKYDSGLFHQQQSNMIVTRGLGVHTLKFRFFNKPELSVIKIEKKK